MDRYYKPKDIINRYSIIKIIGEGRYGIAYLAKNKAGKKGKLCTTCRLK